MKRWLLWNVRCLRGRRCARIVVEMGELPIGSSAVMVEFTCAGCGTRYVSRNGELIRLE